MSVQDDIEVLEALWGIKSKSVWFEGWDTDQEFPRYIPSGKPRRTHSLDAMPVPRFTTDVGPDYAVLARVRDTWGTMQVDDFNFALLTIWQNRYNGFEPHRENVGFHLWYQPGDYTRAALEVMKEKQP